MRLLLSITILYLSLINQSYSENKDCSKFDKLSKEYAKCTSEIIKKKSSELKGKTVTKLEGAKSKIKKFELKKKLKLFKESKSHQEFMEKMKNEN